MIQAAIRKAVDKQDLSQAEAMGAMQEIMEGKATPAQIAAFITALRMKGETVDEIAGCAQAMRASALRIQPQVTPLVDTCGTGGDGSNTFNISTAAALVVAGGGVSVAKHGNRSVSSQCGSADVLEALGVAIDLTPEAVERCIVEIGVGFMFAPRFHASMKHALGPRRDVGIRTIFNVLGPLTNPASAQAQIVGVYSASLTEPIANVLGRLGVKQAYVVHGLDALDEMSISGDTQVSHLKDGKVTTFLVHPSDVGLNAADKTAIAGGDAKVNADIIRRLLRGEEGPRRDVVLLNAGAAFLVAGRAGSLEEGVALAANVIDQGKALETLEALVEFTQGAAA